MPTRNLPPLPPSDPASLSQNRWDSNNQTRAYSFWEGNEVSHTKEKPFTKCNHYFIKTKTGAECQKCHFGLNANLKIQNGKLVINGRSIEF